MKTIIIRSLLGSELRSRASVSRIKECLKDDSQFDLDMTGVEFMSRSFADELCELLKKYDFCLSNMSSFVSDMFGIVKNGRDKVRIRNTENQEIIDCNDMDSLSRLLESI